MRECLGKRDFAHDHHVGRDFDQLVETELPLVHAIQHGSDDRNLVGAGHGEELIAMERDDFLAADLLRRESYAPGKSLRDTRDLSCNGLSISCLAVCGAEGRRDRDHKNYSKMAILHVVAFLWWDEHSRWSFPSEQLW